MENINNISNNQVASRPNRGLVISTLIVSTMVLLRDLGVIPIPPVLCIFVVAVISYLLPYKSLRSFSFFYIVAGSGIHGVAYIPLLAALFFKSKNKNIYQFIFTILILVFELIHFASYSFATDFYKFAVFALVLLFFFFLLFDNQDGDENVRDDIKYYIIGTAVALFVVVLHSIMMFGIEKTLLGYQRLGGGFEEDEIEGKMATIFNSNYMAYYSVVAFTLALFVKGVFKKAWFKVVMMLVVVFAGIMTSSRSWLLVTGIILLIYLLLSRVKNKLLFIITALIVIVAAQQIPTISSAFYDRFEQRIEGQDIREAGMRRKLFMQYHEFLAQHPERLLLGTGALYYRKICAISYSTHNGSQQLVVCYGLLGVLILIWIGIVFHRAFVKNIKHKLWDYVPFFACVLFVQTIQLINPVSLLLPFVAGLLPLKLKQEDN